MAARVLETFALYYSPLDYPGLYVVRRHVSYAGRSDPVPDRDPLYVGAERPGPSVLPKRGLTWLPRYAADEPPILGIWF